MDPISAVMAGINAVGSLFSSSDTNETNLQAVRETNQANREMFNEQLAYNREMWEKQNAYNTPSAQRGRYEAAGINPYLAMSQMNSGNAEMSTAPQPNPQIAGKVQPLDFSGFSRGADILNQSALIQAQRDNLNADSDIKRLQSQTQLARDIADLHKTIADTNVSKQQKRYLSDLADTLEMEYKYIGEKNEVYLQATRAQTRQSLAAAKKDEIYNSELFPIVVKQAQQDLKLSEEQMKLISANVVNAYAQAYSSTMTGKFHGSLAATEDALRNGRVDSLAADIASRQWSNEMNIPKSQYEKAVRYVLHQIGSAFMPWISQGQTAAGTIVQGIK